MPKPEPTTAAPTPTSAAQAPKVTADQACEDGSDEALMLYGILLDSDLTFENGQKITSGSNTWIGASLVRPDGEFESRSDVWLITDGGLYAVSGGAREHTWAVPAPGAGMAHEYAAAVDQCVVAQTLKN